MTPTFSSQRAVPLCARNDLPFQRSRYLGQSCWVAKDPVSLRYVRLPLETYTVLQQLDGEKSITQILAAVNERCPGWQTSEIDIQNAVVDLYQRGLAWSTRPGQGNSLNEHRQQAQWRKTRRTFTNPLFIRLPGFDPTTLLTVFYGAAKWLFHPVVMLWAIGVIVYGWAFMLTHATELSSRLPSLSTLLTTQNTWMLWLVIGGTKIIHELGHAFACRHAKGECHEIGIAFLVFSPCLYCDVSDAWMLKSKWRRIGIGLAGVYVELLLAAFAFYLWWNTADGLVHQISFLTFVVSSVSTLLFNLNPLLKLDGYYLLCDWLEVPNLRQRSDRVLEDACLKWFFGIAVPRAAGDSQPRTLFAAYAFFSTIYRTLLSISILLLIYAVLKPYGLASVGLLLGVATFSIGLVQFGGRIVHRFREHRDAVRHDGARHDGARAIVWASAAIALFALAAWLPLPISLRAPLRVECAAATSIYSLSAGELAAVHVKPGQWVDAGEVLLQLKDNAQTNQRIEQQTRRNVLSVELRKHLANSDLQNATLVRKQMESLDAKRANRDRQQQQLVVRAPVAGRIIEPPTKNEPHSSVRQQLPQWDGTLLQSRNEHCYVQTGTHLLTIAPTAQKQAVLQVTQLDLHELEVGQKVHIRFNHLPERTFAGRIQSIAAASIDNGPANTRGLHRPEETSPRLANFNAVVAFEGDHARLLPGLRGTAKVTIQYQTALRWIWRNVSSTFALQI